MTVKLETVQRDLTAGLVVFFVALPLCLGIALASNAPLFSGLLAGIIGGIIVGSLSGSQSSVAGPAAGLSAIVAAQVTSLGFPAFLLAVAIAGVIQIGLGIFRGGFIAAFVPSSVIKGLLAAIGLILILKQIPHLVGHDADPEGDLAFQQPDHENTLSELTQLVGDFQPAAAVIGILSLCLLVFWDKYKPLKKSVIPAPVVVVLLGVGLASLLKQIGSGWVMGASHYVQVPVAESLSSFLGFLQLPDFSQWSNPEIYLAAVTIAAVASLETLLNLEAVDRIDPLQRTSPSSRELWAQGAGNLISGLVGGLPVTSVIVRSSVNIHAGGRSKLSTITHGVLLLTSLIFLPAWLNMIPLSCLAAILLHTGIKLASPKLVKQMWSQGRYQFIPFAVTTLAIVFTDLLMGILIGLAVAVGFILNSNMRRPIRRFAEKHLGGEVLHIELANQVSFLNRAALNKVLDEVPGGGHVLLDAQNTDYIDPDVLDLIRDFAERGGPARDVEVSMRGFRTKYQLRDQIQFVDYSTQELQSALTPSQVLDILKEGHRRFRTGRRLTRDLGRLVNVTAQGQHPLAVVLSCIDSRTPAELIFDLGVGDIFSVRIAGNVISPNVLGSIEFACVVAGAKLIVVMGHTRCGAVTAAVDRCSSFENAPPKNTCEHLDHIIREIQKVVDVSQCQQNRSFDQAQKETFLNGISRRNITRSVETILHQSSSIERLVREGQVAIVGAIYDVVTGDIDFLSRNSEKMAQCGDSQAILEATNACLVKGAGGERKTPFSNGLKGDV